MIAVEFVSQRIHNASPVCIPSAIATAKARLCAMMGEGYICDSKS
jgi:hypothetical protein